MTRDDIIRMAREAGYQHPDAVGTCEDFAYFDLERFATLIQEATLEKNNLTWVANCQHLVNAEREACAQVCEAWGSWIGDGQLVANAIRARGQRSG